MGKGKGKKNRGKNRQTDSSSSAPDGSQDQIKNSEMPIEDIKEEFSQLSTREDPQCITRKIIEEKSDVKVEPVASTSCMVENEEWNQVGPKISKKGKSMPSEEKKTEKLNRKVVQQKEKEVPECSSQIIQPGAYEQGEPRYMKYTEKGKSPGRRNEPQIQQKDISKDEQEKTKIKSAVLKRGGTRGKEITVITNFFPIDISKVKKACHYDVNIVPEKAKKISKVVMEEFQKKYYPNRYPCFDGKKNLYTSRPLDFPNNELSGEISITENGKTINFQVTVKFVTEVNIPCLNNIGSFATAKSMQAALQCLDVLLRSAVPSYFIPCNRSFVTPPRNEKDADIGGGMELYTGFFQSAVLGSRPFLNIDVAHKAFASAKNIIDLLKVMFRNVDLQSRLKDYQVRELNNFLKDLKVKYEISPAFGKKVYTVKEVVGDAASKTFTVDNKTQTVQEYFKLRKNTNLKYPCLPCLWVGSKDKQIYIPCELCTILPNQAVGNDKLSSYQTTQVIQKVTTNTGERKRRILSFHKEINYNRHEAVKEFQISISDILQEVVARVLEPPQLNYRENVPMINEGKWKPDKFQNGVKLDAWSILCLDPTLKPNDLGVLSEQMIRTGRQMGMIINSCKDVKSITSSRNIMMDLKTYFQQRKHNLIFVVLPSKTFASQNIYNCVKKVSELAVGCLTQCIKSDTLMKRLNNATATNILLKVNAKLNGLNYTLASIPKCLKKYAMIMGADVTHPGYMSEKPSIAAVTASCDESIFRSSFRWGLQPARMEIIINLQVFTEEFIRAYCNGRTRPEQIIYIRDGVSDGQFEEVLQKEFLAIKAACSRIDSKYQPPISIFIVQKRHHTRFFPKDIREAQGAYQNVPAGTCVDTVITNPIDPDFYLVSHASIRGVSRPTKYRILCDESNMSADDIEELMYYLCHMYARCCRSVSYPAPTYYAHLAAARGKVYADEIDNCNDLDAEQKKLKFYEHTAKEWPMFFI